MRTRDRMEDSMVSCLRSLLVASATVAALVPASALAQGGPDASGYVWSTATYDFVVLDPNSGGLGVAEVITGSNYELDVALPWASGFPFYGNSYNDITVSEEGALQMGAGGDIFTSNGAFPDTSSASPDIAVFWDSLDGWNATTSAPNGGVFTYYDAVLDRFIVSWENTSEGGDDATLSFQVHLYGNGDISMHYADVTSEDFITPSTGVDFNSFGGSATVGIQDFTGNTAGAGNALSVSYNSPVLVDGVTAFSITQCVDLDNDGGYDAACGGDDCDDGDPLVFAGQVEVCSDGVDNNCSGYDQVTDQDLDGSFNIACGGDDCNDLDALINPTTDTDGDGSFSCDDCDDNDAALFPGNTAVEVCDGFDSDCVTASSVGATGTNSYGPGTNRSRGGYFVATDNGTLTALGYTADVPVGESITFGLYEGATSSGPWTLLTTATHVSSAAGFENRVSGPISQQVTAGTNYALGVFWTTANVAYGYVSPSQLPQVGPLVTITGGIGSSLGGDSSPAASYTSLQNSSTQYAIQIYGEIFGADAPDELTDADADGVTECLGDCDDNDASAVPGGIEFCGDGVDNDCSGAADDIDADLDGEFAVLCGGVDCNDGDATINTAAAELCDGVDSDCDGLEDGQDFDVDPTLVVLSGANLVNQATGTVTDTITLAGATSPILDVNVTVNVDHTWDSDLEITLTSPAGTSVFLTGGNGGQGDDYANTTFDDEATCAIDDTSCASPPFTGSFMPENPLSVLDGEAGDGIWTILVDDTFGTQGTFLDWSIEVTTGTALPDGDGDGWVNNTVCVLGGDCDDADGSVFPGAAEICGDTLDQDCDGVDLLDDIDLDTFGSVACGGTDCDDNDANVFDGSDFDLDLALGCQDDCNDNDATIGPLGVEVCNDGIDQDCDGVDLGAGAVDNDLDGETTCTDCDDTDPTVNAAATEVCGDGIDNNCSGVADDVDADADGDTSVECGGGDCDEANALISSLAVETCDGVDENCDGVEDGQDFSLAPPNPFAPSSSPGAAVSNSLPPTEDTITVATGSTDVINDINLTLNIDHTWDGDMEIVLASPAGTAVTVLASGTLGNDDNLSDTVFDDQAAAGITSGTAPFSGSFIPDNPLSAFDGEAIDGVWTLTVTDTAGGDDGVLNNWTLSINNPVISTDLDGDGWMSASLCSFGDCDDDPALNPDAATVNPGADEICGDGIDQDCDLADLVADVDLDTYSSVACGGNDCDDADATINAGAAEVCNDAVDNDCDEATLDVFDVDGDGVDCITDCDDADALSYPGFYELCNDGADNDCDAATPDLNDADGDGDDCVVDCDDTNPLFGPSQPELLCSGVDEDCDFGVTTPDIDDGDLDGFDCDEECLDTDAAVNPAALEVACDGLDNDCDPATDGEVDVDLDGSTCGFDCDDNEPLAFPGNTEACNDAIDNDCDPSTVDAFDLDLDGVTCITDCDDNDPLSFPGAPEICADGIDQDCDQSTDELANDSYALSDDDSVLIDLCGFSFPFCGTDWTDVYVSSNGRLTFGFNSGEHTESSAIFLAETPEIAAFWNDLDPSAGGTVEVEEVADTGVGASLIITYTDVPELGVVGSANSVTMTLFDDGTANFVYGGLSMDDGLVGFSCGTAGDIIETDISEYEMAPNAWAVGQGTESAVYEVFTDVNPNDLDSMTVDLCLTGGDDLDADGWTDTCGDCDDAEAGTFPGSDEVCGDGIDQDCDGTADNADLDGDGEVDVACGGDDCDDADELINTAATEICNGIDDDCDGSPEDGGADDDGDGFLICGGDCDDSNADINPDAVEVCDQVDNDCDGALDNGFTPDFDNDGQVSEDCAGEDCDDTNDSVFVGAIEVCDLADNDCNGLVDEIDVDEDGFIDGNCNGDDCNDADAAVNPGATEVPYDGIDNDCSEGDVVDADGDGFFGGEGGNDCDDGDAAINPDAEEICDDTIDNNCDGGADKGDKDNDVPADAVCSACNCSSSLVDADAPTGSAMLFIGLMGVMGLRRRRQ